MATVYRITCIYAFTGKYKVLSDRFYSRKDAEARCKLLESCFPMNSYNILLETEIKVVA